MIIYPGVFNPEAIQIFKLKLKQ